MTTQAHRRKRRPSGHLWMIRTFGLRRWWRYEQARRSRYTVDFSLIFTPAELALLGEHFHPARGRPTVPRGRSRRPG